ncbi:MAG: hypothetical protein QXF04_01380 [Candidatus Aenigmatarchaeota archaeon]
MGKEVKVYGFVRCANCKGIIHGVPRAHKLRKLPLSKKRVERIYGGYLCSKCTRETIKEKIRKEFKLV